jgi:hypothetical protein
MFNEELRKKLTEQGWLGAFKEDSNPWQTRRRIKDSASKEIRDLTLLAKILPDNEFQEVFNKESLKEFFESLFYFNERNKMDSHNYDADLASEFVSIGVGICSSKYQSLNADSPNTAKPVLEYLQRTIDICNEIGYKNRIEMIEKEANKKNQKYICRLEEIGRKDASKFYGYLVKELNLSPYFDIVQAKTTTENDINHKEFFFKLEELGSEAYIGLVVLDVFYDKNICKLSFDGIGGNKIEKELIVNKSGKNYLLLEKNNPSLSKP